MKKFTLILTSMLFLLVGGVFSQEVTTLYLNGGQNWSATDGINSWGSWDGSTVTYTAGDVTINQYGRNLGMTGLTGSNWCAPFTEGEIHTFKIELNEAPGHNHFELVGGTKAYDSFEYSTDLIVSVIGATDTEATLVLNHSYDGVYLLNNTASGETIKIKSITRTITTASSVAAPTISPASGTYYDGDLSVTITKGEGNDRVVYSVSGATTGNATNAEFTENSKTLNLTGTGTITVTATGYKGGDASSEVTNTYTYGVPSGKGTATVTYYSLIPVTIAKGESQGPAFYDFEDDVTIGVWGNEGHDAPTVSVNTTDAIKGSKCMYVKNEGSKGTDWHAEFGFNTPDGDDKYLKDGHTYLLRFWAKAESTQKVDMNFKNRDDWSVNATKQFEIGTDWEEYKFTFVAGNNNITNFSAELGGFNTGLYFDDFGLFDITSTTSETAFSDATSTAVIAASAFDDYAANDYICLNVTGTPTEIGYKTHATDDEQAIYLTSYTNLEQTNGNWLIPVTSDIKTNGLSIKGYSMTLNSVDIYKKEAISEATNNTISSKENNVVVELTRSFVKDTWNTVCLPFVPTADQANTLFGEGYKLAAYTSVSGTTMHFTPITINEFVAGKPYLVMPKTGCATGTTVLFDVDITAKNPTPVTFGNYTFTGTFTTKTFTSDDNTTSRFVAAENELVTPKENSTLKSLRCYFAVPAAARSLSFDVDEEGGTTSINTVQGSGVMVNGYYNLNGQRVAQPTKGLYIVNGKKVVIK
jgi:hypothetical protein